MTSGAGAFLTNFANGFSSAQDRKAMLETNRLALEDRRAARADYTANRAADRLAYDPESAAPSGDSGSGAVARGGGGNIAPMRASDPVATDLSPEARAVLNAIAAPESNGVYNVRYTPRGGERFDLSGGHPRIYENGPAGKSSAAGRYQFTWSTWKDTAGENTPFTEENQDRYAWQLATDRYRRSTGRDLQTDVAANGFTADIARTLTPTWAGLNNPGKSMATYADSIARYTAAPPADAAPAGPQEPLGRSLNFGQQLQANLKENMATAGANLRGAVQNIQTGLSFGQPAQ